MLQLIKIRCGHTHSAKASLKSFSFHGKLITIIRLLITSSLSTRQRNLLFVTFVLLSHPLCQNQPPKRLRPGLCLQLAPFHHNYTAEQNQAPALERVHRTSNYCFTTGYKSVLHFLKELHDLSAFHFTCICQRSPFAFYSSSVRPISETFHTAWMGPKAKLQTNENQKEQSCIKLDFMTKSISFSWLVSLQKLMHLPLISQWYKRDIVPSYLEGWAFFFLLNSRILLSYHCIWYTILPI